MADFMVSNPAIRWIWVGTGNEEFGSALTDFRPSDRESMLEMMQGRYLLANKLVDTNGASPFALDMVHNDWLDDLQSFAWLRHFRDARSDKGTLASADCMEIDDRPRQQLGALHPGPVADRAARAQLAQAFRAAGRGRQSRGRAHHRALHGHAAHSLKLRAPFADDPVDALMAALALLGVALCDTDHDNEVQARLDRVNRLLDAQIDEDGLHRSRSAKLQLLLDG